MAFRKDFAWWVRRKKSQTDIDYGRPGQRTVRILRVALADKSPVPHKQVVSSSNPHLAVAFL